MATATYSGPAWGLLNEPSGVTNVTGTTSLTANFGTNTLTGGLNNMTRADGSQWANLTINGQWGAGVNAISGSIAADNGMSGAMNGAFFGPSAQEIGGNWSVSGSGSSAAGVFVGK
jgi:hypothetical protein